MKNRLAQFIEKQKQTKEKALVVFFTAGYPNMDATEKLILASVNCGADIIEIGIPFSDPVADGPTIQYASEYALKNGATLAKALLVVKKVRVKTQVPIVLMGYMNTFVAGGAKKSFTSISDVGVDGVIIADIVPEENKAVEGILKKYNLAQSMLIAPNTSAKRMSAIANKTTGFVYVVSVSGVTGARKGFSVDITNYLKKTKAVIANRARYVGFGIGSAKLAKELAPFCDGVIVGSALINIIKEKYPKNTWLNNVCNLIKNIKKAIK